MCVRENEKKGGGGVRISYEEEEEEELARCTRGFPLNKCDRSSLDYITCGQVATTLRMHRGVRICDSKRGLTSRHLSYRRNAT